MTNKGNRIVFISGLFLGSLLYQFIPSYFKSYKLIERKRFSESGIEFELYESDLAKQLYNDVKIVCWINMAPKFHQTKAIHIKNTWGKRCNKLLFMSHEDDPNLPAINLPIPEGLNHFWAKFKLAFAYVYKNHLNDGDYFLKADDDTYIVMENLRHMLYQYRPQTALFFGHRYARADLPDQGFMQGGAYVMSKKLLSKFITKLAPNMTLCGPEDGWAEDNYLAHCVANWTIFVDDRDDKKQKRFMSYGVDWHFLPHKDMSHWYWDQMFYDVEQGMGCCSETVAQIHNLKNVKEIYLLEYLIYHVDVFGLEKNVDEKLPRKFSMKEVLEMANIQSNSKQWTKHNIFHQMDKDEYY